ncbi:2'-5' RNA ligase family protein [Streptomyces clavuligerus]|uniref:2'-5' RNA ligase family protein n=1 Tax=Streptomyces clavuligerus TaxID=1901 RepID=UPI000185216A|nr:2'-5' RNA ligase family protein [Streptomyces clavuligerus]WDN55982.1 2'-5' RNA ligase family protein [Streptomyces clavuligerus]
MALGSTALTAGATAPIRSVRQRAGELHHHAARRAPAPTRRSTVAARPQVRRPVVPHRTGGTPEQLAGLARTVSEHAPRAFTLSAHPLTGSRGAVRHSLTPWTPLLRLHTVLTAAARHHGLPTCRPTAGFRPHLGIAYNNRERDACPVIDAAAELRTLPAVPLSIDRAELVELRREGPTYRWNPLHTARLAPSIPAGPGRPTPGPGSRPPRAPDRVRAGGG